MSSEDDCNNFGIGIYLCDSNVKDTPCAGWWLILSANVSGTAVQIAYMLGTEKVYRRYCASGSWSLWENMHQIKLTEVRLSYKSATEMYGESDVSGIPLGQFVANRDGTPWSTVNYAVTTRVGAIIKCSAFGNGFVPNHALVVVIPYIAY